MKPRGNTPLQRILLGVVLPVFVFVNIVVAGALSRPEPAYAQWISYDPINFALNQLKYVGEIIAKGIWDVLAATVLSTSAFMLQTFAMDAATYLADSAHGKNPVFYETGFDNYLKNTADAAIGNALTELAKDWTGLDLCEPGDIQARLSIQLGLRNPYKKPGARCTFKGIGDVWDKQWEKIKDQYGGCTGGAPGAAGAASRVAGGNKKAGSVEDCMMELAKDVFKPANTELGISAEASLKIANVVNEKKQESILERQEGGGYKRGINLAGQTTKPADINKEEGKTLSNTKKQDRTLTLVAGAMGSDSKSAVLAVPTIFGTTFLTRYLANFFEPKPQAESEIVLGELGTDGGGPPAYGVSREFASLVSNTINVRDAGIYDTLSIFLSCPSEGGTLNRRPDECVIDADFEAAVRSAESGEPLTIGQALEKRLLQSNWRLVPPTEAGLNSSVSCRNQAYCHANIAKLRQARILPLGFEIAAALSPPGTSSWKLGEVVSGFNDCSAAGARDETYKFCHLIDPNWILKAPLTRCQAEVPGPMLASKDANIRHNVCVDKPTCLQDDGKGSCQSPFGYCVREKNVWRTDADLCPAQFATCATYNGASPGAQKKISYLSRTVDFSACTENDVGCRQYAFSQSDDGQWEQGRGASRYYNGKAENCTQPGCTQFIRENGDSAYLKKAPNYLHCYDSQINNVGDSTIDWPRTIADIAKLRPRTECKDYAPACAVEEVGCSRFTPTDGTPAVPAITAAGDRCAAECVGYNTYKQLATTGEQAKFPVYFIPTTAQMCNGAHVGCDQYVDVASEKFEYYSFVRQCEKPTDNNSAVFYAWEGSDAEGYQLRSYVLKISPAKVHRQDANGIIPAYAAQYDTNLMAEYFGVCNKELYQGRGVNLDPDCRELFDRNGVAFYRLLAHTVTVSEECKEVRKTDGDLYIAPRNQIGARAACDAAKGRWDAARGCEVCSGGGANKNGLCFFSVIQSEAVQCPAQANGCRAYTGNAGNNIRVWHQSTFDDLDVTAWETGVLSPESVVVGGKSWRFGLAQGGGGRTTKLQIALTATSSYSVTFWAKGIGTLSVNFEGVEVEGTPAHEFRLTGDWHQFSFGPVNLKSVGADPHISFTIDQNNTPVFLDNVVVRGTIDTFNVIKKSWETPASCDANPNDNIPGEALGCREYRDQTGGTVALKSFTRICRDEAVGCERLTDTKNTPEVEGKTYHAHCGKTFIGLDGATHPTTDRIDPDSRACTPDFDADGDGVKEASSVCTLPLGQDYCTFTAKRLPGFLDFDYHWGANVQVGADDVAYLVNRPEFQCNAGQKGCMAQGEIKGSGDGKPVTTVNKLVDPEKYDQILCRVEVVGCEAYKVEDLVGNNNRTVYFKDPSVTGKAVCEFKENVDGDSGWFISGTSNPCYANYRTNIGNGIRSQGDGGYDGRVGSCPPEQNSCKELRDPLDTSQLYPEGQPYYVLDNGKLDRASCNGQGSLQKGCVLFNDTGIPAQPWDVGLTYRNSQKNNNAPAPAVTVGTQIEGALQCGILDKCGDDGLPLGWTGVLAGNTCPDGFRLQPTGGLGDICVPMKTANTILKVVRDRACGEWLACESSQTVINPTNNQPKAVCNAVALCDQYARQGNFDICAHWVDTPQLKGKILKETKAAATPAERIYSSRAVDWYAKEYSGYSLYDKYQISDIK